jgi:hypothetical protein
MRESLDLGAELGGRVRGQASAQPSGPSGRHQVGVDVVDRAVELVLEVVFDGSQVVG